MQNIEILRKGIGIIRKSIEILGKSIEIENIRTEPKITSQGFIVTGRGEVGSGHTVHLDFGAMRQGRKPLCSVS